MTISVYYVHFMCIISLIFIINNPMWCHSDVTLTKIWYHVIQNSFAHVFWLGRAMSESLIELEGKENGAILLHMYLLAIIQRPI